MWLALALALGTGAYLMLASGSANKDVRYQTAAVEKGRLVVTVSATGTLQPTNQVDVGSELSGTIQNVFVDDNSPVTKGQVLARLDVSKLEDQVANPAAVNVAEAAVRQADATVQESRQPRAAARGVLAVWWQGPLEGRTRDRRSDARPRACQPGQRPRRRGAGEGHAAHQ